MIEIIVLLFLCFEINKITQKKQLPQRLWIIRFIVAWILSELLGLFIGLLVFGRDNLFSVSIIGVGFALTAFLMLKEYLQKQPDNLK
jgi:hypothetical protein